MLNHPLHPALVHFPIGVWGIASALDVLVVIGIKPAEIWPISSGLIGVGLVMALLAMAAGVFDLVKITKHQSEPPRVYRRLIYINYAATGRLSRLA